MTRLNDLIVRSENAALALFT